MCGQVINIYENPKGVDRKTGEEYGGGFKVQLLADVPLKNGSTRNDLVTLTIDNPAKFEPFKGDLIRIAVGAYSLREGQVGYYALKGASPEAIKP